MVEEWPTDVLGGGETLISGRCYGQLYSQKVHMYVNVDRELEEVLCEGCWEIAQEEEE